MPETFYLRFIGDDEQPWLRRSVFGLAYARSRLLELAEKFTDRDQALAFAKEMKLQAEVELVTLSSEAIEHG